MIQFLFAWQLYIYGSGVIVVVFFQAEDGIRDLVRSRGLGDVYKRQVWKPPATVQTACSVTMSSMPSVGSSGKNSAKTWFCLLYTSDAADERSSVDLGGRRIIKKKKKREPR